MLSKSRYTATRAAPGSVMGVSLALLLGRPVEQPARCGSGVVCVYDFSVNGDN
jgi:hypothetical protein